MSEDVQMSAVLTALTSRYPQSDPQEIAHRVQSARERFASSRIRDYVPLLVERRVRSELSTAPR